MGATCFRTGLLMLPVGVAVVSLVIRTIQSLDPRYRETSPNISHGMRGCSVFRTKPELIGFHPSSALGRFAVETPR